MHNLILIIPLLFAVGLLVFWHRKIVWWEYLVVIGGAIIINLLVITLMKYSNCDDVEYRGDYVVKVEHYEEWNEWVQQTCTRTDSEGNSELYDCSYCRTHSPYWNVKTKLNNDFQITHMEYASLRGYWKVPQLYVDMARNYHTKDGDKYEYKWNNNINQLIPITLKTPYQNKIKGSTSSVFKFTDVPDSIKKYLFEYPELTTINKVFVPRIKNVCQDGLLGYEDVELKDKINAINALSGPVQHIRTYILVFKDKPQIYAHYQKSYWSGGNFNEHVICVGLNTTTNKFDWVETFSWEETPYLSVKSKQWLRDNNNITSLSPFMDWYGTILNENKTWVCRSNDDFDYLDIELTGAQLLWLFIISCIYCSVVCFLVINNESEY